MSTVLHNLNSIETRNLRLENGQVDFMITRNVLIEDMDYSSGRSDKTNSSLNLVKH